MRQQVPQLRLVYEGQTIPAITVSAGMTIIADQTEAVDNALKRADDALYQAKHAGRNRTVVAATPSAAR